MIVTVFDTESDGFLDVATKIWCIASVVKDGYNDVTYPEQLWEPKDVNIGLDYLHDSDVLVGHNIKKHDLPLMKKLYDWEPKSHQVIIDTLTFSRMLNPKRPLPEGYTGRATHSIEAWGYRLGLHKPDHTEWDKWSEEMGTRCLYDAKINLLVLEELEREAGDISNYYERIGIGSGAIFGA